MSVRVGARAALVGGAAATRARGLKGGVRLFMGMGLLFVMGRRRARVAAISERVIMMSRMPRPRAILAPRLRAMVAAIVLK